MLKVTRTEMKYILPLAEREGLKAELDGLLERDPYMQGERYLVRSLYFDSLNNADYYEKLAGDEIRKKIRLRIYDPDQETAKLEIKEKHGALQRKQSLTVTREEAERMVRGDLTPMLNHGEEGIRLYTVMTLGAYRPAAMIEYHRSAWIYPSFHVRITFDQNIRCGEYNLNLWEKNGAFLPVSEDGQVILEVKYDEKLPASIKSVLARHRLVNVSFSKYQNGRILSRFYL